MQNKTIHDYTLKYSLGKGGMAEVWYAENVLGNPATVKVLLKEYSFNEQIVNRFEAEAKIMVKLKHPNIRKVISYGEVYERPAIIMEYLEGEDLSTKLSMRKLYTNDDLVHWWNQAVEALSHTHSKGIVHRDIKPSNLFITIEGNLKLLDFGIAKIKEGVTYTKTGQTMGTPLYMSPEQVKDSKHVDASTDAYSLAVSFVQLVSRQNPYGLTGEPSRFDIETAIVSQSVATEHLDQPWNTLLKNYLQKEAKQRQKLSLYQEDEATLITQSEKTKIVPPPAPSKPKPQPTVPDTPPNPKKNKAVWIGVVAVVLLLIGGIWWWQDRNDPIKQEQRLWTELQGKTNSTVADYDAFLEKYPNSPHKELAEEKRLFLQNIEAIKSDLIPYRKGDKWGFIDKNGTEVIAIKYDAAYSFSEGLARVRLNDKWGFVDKNGTEVIAIKYDAAYSFSEGLGMVRLNDKWGFVDKNGTEVPPLKYDSVTKFTEGLAMIKLNGKWGFIDKNGKLVIPLQYEYGTGSFSEGLAKVFKNGKCGFIDKNGKIIIPLQYDIGTTFFSKGLAGVVKNGKQGFIDKGGKMVIPYLYEEGGVWGLGYFSEGIAMVRKDFKYGFINKSGKLIVPIKYEHGTNAFSEDLAEVVLNGKCGFIDKNGNEVIAPKYDDAYTFSEGLAIVKLNGKWGFIDKNGSEVVAPKYDFTIKFSEGLALVKLNGKYGYIDKNGTEYWED